MHDKYGGKASQEQNSLNVGWEVLMRPDFDDLREALYQTKEEFGRFRQILVRQVIATEVFDPQMAEARLARWQEAFSEQPPTADIANRKATAVMELLIQVGDISHIVQSWNRYVKWNTNLFTEMHAAYKNGYMEKDISETWYEGELKFLDSYVIPLATRLEESGSFGSDWLKNVKQNRERWEENGKSLVHNMMIKCKADDDDFTDAVEIV